MDNDPKLLVPVRRRGRPPAEERLEQVGVSLPPSYVKRLEQLAQVHDMSMSKLVRNIIILRLR